MCVCSVGRMLWHISPKSHCSWCILRVSSLAQDFDPLFMGPVLFSSLESSLVACFAEDCSLLVLTPSWCLPLYHAGSLSLSLRWFRPWPGWSQLLAESCRGSLTPPCPYALILQISPWDRSPSPHHFAVVEGTLELRHSGFLPGGDPQLSQQKTTGHLLLCLLILQRR